MICEKKNFDTPAITLIPVFFGTPCMNFSSPSMIFVLLIRATFLCLLTVDRVSDEDLVRRNCQILK